MIIQGNVGPLSTTTSLGASLPAPVRLGNMGDMIASELHGRYYEAAYRQSVFSLSLATAATITAYIGATGGTPALATYNPVGSGKNLVVLQAGVANLVTPTGAGTAPWGLWYGLTALPTGQNTVPTNNSTLTTSGSIALGWVNAVTTSSTALTRVYPLAFYYWATAAGAFGMPSFVDIAGSVIIPPGGMVALGCGTALTTASWYASLIWEEVPI